MGFLLLKYQKAGHAEVIVKIYLTHPDLAHQLVLVSVHASQLPHMRKSVLQPICQLEGVYISQAELDIGIHNQLCQSQNLSAAVKTSSERLAIGVFGECSTEDNYTLPLHFSICSAEICSFEGVCFFPKIIQASCCCGSIFVCGSQC